MSTRIRCGVCNVELSSNILLETHKEGKRHRRRVEEHQKSVSLVSRSVFLTGLNLNGVPDCEVKRSMEKFGEVDRVLVDIVKRNCAIIEFADEVSTRRALDVGEIEIENQIGVIKARKVDFDNSERRFEKNVNVDKVIGEMKVEQMFLRQVEVMAQRFCLSESKVQQREDYAKEVASAFSQYFASDVVVKVFGSTITSIGTLDSDIDATVLFGDKILKHECCPELGRDKYSLMTCSADTFLSRRVQPEEIGRLTAADRIRFLTKVINHIRRRRVIPISDQYPVLDAKCPLVRFLYRKQEIFDLSVDNRLGYAKSDLIRQTILSDPSSTVRLFLVATRFWALSNGLMRKDEITRGHFNAYMLNLLCIVFLQLSGHLKPFEAGSPPVIVDNWNISFVVSPCDMSSCSLRILLKEFFAWFIQVKIKNIVFCPRIAKALTREDFIQEFPDEFIHLSFKFSHFNIQDPLELSHNVASLLNEKYLHAMRRHMMISLATMKSTSTDFISILRQPESPAPNAQSDLEFHVNSNGASLEKSSETIDSVLLELLGFVPCEEPMAKKSRIESPQFWSKTYVVNQPCWMGRRGLRRQILKNNPEASEWEVEKQITEMKKADTLAGGSPLKFIVSISLCNDELTVKLSHIHGSELDLHNLSHFLSVFLPRYFPTALSLKSDAMEE